MNLAEAEWNRCKKDYGPQIETTEAGGCMYDPQSSMRGGPLDPDAYGNGQVRQHIRLNMLTKMSVGYQTLELTPLAAAQLYLKQHASRKESTSKAAGIDSPGRRAGMFATTGKKL